MQDKDLITLIKENAEKGLLELMNRYLGLVYSVVRGSLAGIGSREDIEECASDILLELYNNIDRIDLSRGAVKAYLCTIAKRRSIDRYRLLQRQPHAEQAEEAELVASGPCCEDTLIESQTKELLVSSIRSLRAPDTEIFLRRYYLRQSTCEIAKALHMKGNTIDKRISRGLAKLKTMMEGLL